jgi:peptidoglycan/xylan/chitin deacetylase (PgdA/CDA1 family)
MGFDHPYRIGGITEVPVHWTIDDAIFFRYFGGGRDSAPPMSPVLLLDAWRHEFDAIVAEGGLFMITVHPWMSGRAGRVKMLRRLFAHIQARDDVWWTTTAEIARWHDSSANADRFRVEPDPVDTDI